MAALLSWFLLALLALALLASPYLLWVTWRQINAPDLADNHLMRHAQPKSRLNNACPKMLSRRTLSKQSSARRNIPGTVRRRWR